MFFDTKQKILFAAAVIILLFAAAATVARINRKPDLKALPAEMQKVVPMDKPTNIELEDDAGVGTSDKSGEVQTNNPQRDAVLNTWDTRYKQDR